MGLILPGIEKRSISRVLILIVVIGGWTFLWKGPWQLWLASWPWVRLIVAVLMFALPGICLQQLICKEPPASVSRHLSLGFAISVALTGILGLLASAVHFSIRFVTGGLFAVGGVGLLALVVRGVSLMGERTGIKARAWTFVTALPALAAILLAARLCLAPGIGGDDYTYVAYLTAFEHSEGLGFEEIFFGSGNRAPSRFWLAYWPLAEAVLAKNSGLHGLQLIGIYLAAFLAVLSLLGVFELARSLGLSRRGAYLALIAQVISLLFLTHQDQAGEIFFNRLTEDKVVAAFVLTPVLFRLVVDFLDEPKWQRLGLLLLVSLGVAFTHPTILGIACLISALYGLLDLTISWKVRAVTLLLSVLVAVPIVPFSLRFVDDAFSELHPFTLEDAQQANVLSSLRTRRLEILDGSRFYGINPGLVRGIPFEVGVAAGVLALFQWRQSRAARYIVASLVVVASAIVPYTGWLLGLAITPFHLWRVLWLTPFGVGIAFLVASVVSSLIQKLPQTRWHEMWASRFVIPTAELLLLLGVAYVLPISTEGNLRSTPLPPGWEQSYDDLINIGHQLDVLIPEQAILIGSDLHTNNLIPALSAKAKVVAFRYAGQTVLLGNFDEKEAADRMAVWQKMIGAEERITEQTLATFKKYDVTYVLVKRERGEIFGSQFRWLSSLLTPRYENNNYKIYEMTGTAPSDHDRAVINGNTYFEQGEWEEAITGYEKALALDPGDTWAYFAVGQVHRVRGEIEQAEAAYLDAINAEVYNVLARAALAQVYVAQGRTEEAIQQYKEAIRLCPDYLALHEGLGDIYLMQGRVDEAVAEYEKAIGLAPGTADYHSELGFLLYSKGLNERAIEEYLKAIDLDSYSSLVYYRLGTAYRAEERLEEALYAYKQAIKIEPDYIMARVGIGHVYKAQGQIAEAITQYRSAIDANPHSADAYLALGNLYKDQGEIGEAITVYQQAIAMQPECVSCYCQLGEAYEARGESEQAIAEYQQAIEVDPDSATPYVLLGNLYRDLGEVEAAVDTYERAVALLPNSAYTYITLGKLYEEQGRVEEAVAMYKQATTVQPDRSDSHVLLGKLYKAQGNLKAAIEEYERAIEIDPDSAAPYVALGDLYAAEGKTDQAVTAYRQATAVEPDYLPSYNGMGRVYEDRGEVEMAIASYRDAIGRFPDSPWPYLALGDLYRREKRLEEALTAYQQAVMLNPDYVPGRIRLGGVYKALGDLEKALTVYQQAMAIEPDNQALWKAFPPLSVEQPMRIKLGDSVRFLGYAADSEKVEANGSLRLTFYWQGLERMDTSYTVFVHLLGANSQFWGQEDTPPCQADCPTVSWPLETVITDEHEITIDPQTPPGEYVLEMGMYDVATGERLGAYDEQLREWLPEARILLGKVVVR